MANTIPCPNPACTHQFGLAELQSAAQLLCPQCGFRMQGKAPATAKPVAKAPPPQVKVAAARPIAAKPAPPVAADPTPADAPISTDGSIAEGSFFNPGAAPTGPLLRTNAPVRKPLNRQRLLINTFAIGSGVCLVIAVLAGIVVYMSGYGGFGNSWGQGDADYIGYIKNAKKERESVYKLNLAKTEWAFDGEIANHFAGPPAPDNLVTAWKDLTGYDAWFVLAVKDHGMHRPRDAEMLQTAIEKLEKHFGNDLELGEKAEPAKFGALPAQKLRFRGVIMSATWEGDCWMFFNNGIAYWLFLAAPRREDVDSFADVLPDKHVIISSERRGWREQPWPTETFASAGDKVEVTAPKGVWEKSNPASEGPTAKLLLGGKYRREKDNTKNALMVVFALDKQTDLKEALKSARAHLEARERESNEKAKVMLATEVVPGQTEVGTLEDVGRKRGRVIDLKLMLEEKQPYRYFLLAVITEADATYAIVCECSWASRQIWRQDFLDVLRSLRVQ